MASIHQLYEQVAERCGTIASSHGDWPCRRGCDSCCRRLAALPSATASEWQRIGSALHALREPDLEAVRTRLRTAGHRHDVPGPITCPLLDPVAGSCIVYADRPLACRTYGFYFARDGGRWCDRIETIAETASVVWGNHDAIDAAIEEPLIPLPATVLA